MLPDILEPGLALVFCGTAVGTRSAARGHYYSGRGNKFWQFLYTSGLTPVLLTPEQDHALPRYGIGLTDIAKGIAQSHDRGLDPYYDVDAFINIVKAHAPVWVAFHGKEAARIVSKRVVGSRALLYGEQDWRVADARVFVVPSASGSNNEPRDPERRRRRLEGKDQRVDWYRELAALVESTRG